jgi:hypothetical protein
VKTFTLATLGVLGVLFGSAAQAEVKPFGTFIPQLCGQPVHVRGIAPFVAPTNVCFGKLNGTDQKAISVSFPGSHVVYNVIGERPLVGPGNKQSTELSLSHEETGIADQAILTLLMNGSSPGTLEFGFGAATYSADLEYVMVTL